MSQSSQSFRFVRFVVGAALTLLTVGNVFARSTIHGATENQIKVISGGLEVFKAEYGRYPTEAEGIKALTNRPPDIPEAKWHPYFNSLSLDDLWGRNYIYRYPGVHNKKTFDLYSLGADGVSKSGGSDADDINNWDTTRKWSRLYERPSWIKWSGLLAVGLAIVTFIFWGKREHRLDQHTKK